MDFNVEITDIALAEAEEVCIWIRQHSNASDSEWFDGLMEAINSLEKSPQRCSLAPENDAFDEEIRQLLYGKRRNTYRIIFTVSGQTVYILHIRHASRQLLDP